MPQEQSQKIELPHALEAEQRVLGSILLEPQCLPNVRRLVQPDHFYMDQFRTVYKALLELDASGHPIDAGALADKLRLKNFPAPGAFVSKLLEEAPTSANVEYFCRLITDRALSRNIITFGQDLQKHGLTADPHELIRLGVESMAKMNGLPGQSGDLRILRGAVPGDVLLDMEIPRPASIVGNGVLVERSFILLYGQPGLGKTWAMLQMAVAIATGRDWFGLPCEKRRVGILEMELDSYYLRERLELITSYLDPDVRREALSNIEVVCRPNFTGIVDLREDATRNGIITWVTESGLSVVMMDALSRMHYANERDAKEMGQVLGSIERIRDEAATAIVGIHHEPKASGSEQQISDIDAARGSSRLQSDPHTMIRLKRLKGKICMTFPKMNLGEVPEDIFLDRENGPLVLTSAPIDAVQVKERNVHLVMDKLFQAGKDGLTLKELADDTGLSRETIRKHLKNAGLPAAPKGGAGKTYRFVHPDWDSVQGSLIDGAPGSEQEPHPGVTMPSLRGEEEDGDADIAPLWAPDQD